MLYLAGLGLLGWKCYRAAELQLEAKPYAVVARYEGEADRSNWAGKSSLLQAVHYALEGALPEDAETKDDVITRGESKAEVTAHLSSGSRVVRTKTRGRPEKLWYYPAAGGPALLGREAQAAVDAELGLSADDFTTVSYFKQRQMARFILQSPASRLADVSGWLRLERLERGEGAANLRLARRLRELEDATRALARAAEAEERVRAEAAVPAGFDALACLDAEVARWDGEAERLRAEHEAALQLLRDYAAQEDRAATRARLEAVVEEGKLLAARAVPEAELARLRAEHERASGALAAAQAETLRLAGEAEGRRARGFDGVCPVTCNLCPVAREVSAQTDALARAAAAADAAHEAAVRAERERYREATLARHEREQAEEVHSRLALLRERARALREEAGAVAKSISRESLPDADALLRGAREAEHRAVSLRHARGVLLEARELGRVAAEKVELARAAVQTAREAQLVFGKNGAQRRVAERALEQIGRDATRALEESGVPLSVALRWSREGKDPATACAECGSPFPPSARVKTCERCGAERGLKLVHRLDVVLSDRSGAAEDLASFHLQVAAAAWRRRDLGAAWGALLLDEPTGQLDLALRRRFTAHLSAAFSRSAFDQALVVAHHASVLDALPGRIEIVAGPGGSSATVVA